MAQSYIPLNQTDSRTLSNAYCLTFGCEGEGSRGTLGAESVMAPVGLWGDERIESSDFRSETEKDGSLDTATVFSSKASLKCRRFGGRSVSGERQSSGSAQPVEASLSASWRMRRCRMSCRAFVIDPLFPTFH